jgi:hypothetical protein
MTDEELVVSAERIIDSARKKLDRHEVTGRTQLSQAIEVAKTTQSPKVFANWLRYQKAREEFWRVDAGEVDIAKATHQTIEAITSNRSGADAMKEIVRFLGFLRRALIAKDHFGQIPVADRR